MLGFVGNLGDRREAALRLENRRLRPLGHLTALRSLSIYDISVYEAGVVPAIVPESVPVKGSEWSATCEVGF
jgi:hypothetical protein